jgi:phosphoribosylformylglycinamidine cyclo-ligase
LRAVRPLLERSLAKGLAHITGGGITDNLPRILPPGTAAEISRAAWEPPAIFRLLQHRGGIADDEMLRAFNMGIGLIIACAPDAAASVAGLLHAAGERDVYRVGRIVPGDRVVRYT